MTAVTMLCSEPTLQSFL